MTDFPGILAIVAEVAGDEAAAALARAKGGVRCYIPARAREGHWLTALVGMEAAEAICRALGSGEVEVPLWHTGLEAQRRDARRRAAELIRRGWSNAKVARAVGYSERNVKRIRARLRDHARQPDLFSYSPEKKEA